MGLVDKTYNSSNIFTKFHTKTVVNIKYNPLLFTLQVGNTLGNHRFQLCTKKHPCTLNELFFF